MRLGKRFRRVLLILASVLLIVIVGFVIWAETPLGPDQTAVAALQTRPDLAVETERWIVFRPLQQAPTTGLIFYPGGRVDPRSYAPTAQAIADDGYLVVIVPMPLNLAVLGINRGNDVIEAFPQIQHWAIGGHSLGGAMACTFIRDQPNAVQALVLLGAYCSGADLSQLALQVVEINGSQDGVINRENLRAGDALLPPTTTRITIEGGNHAQFGSYGPQPGDNAATISADDQRKQVVDATVAVLDQISNE